MPKADPRLKPYQTDIAIGERLFGQPCYHVWEDASTRKSRCIRCGVVEFNGSAFHQSRWHDDLEDATDALARLALADVLGEVAIAKVGKKIRVTASLNSPRRGAAPVVVSVEKACDREYQVQTLMAQAIAQAIAKLLLDLDLDIRRTRIPGQALDIRRL